MTTIFAPAKINLTLEILRKRPDGYHEICSIMQAISLFDVLDFQEADGLKVYSDNDTWDGRISLVVQAVNLLRERTGTRKGASIFVQKHIPLLSGLGGDSSDAVAALTGLNTLWNLGLGRGELMEIARKLGSDLTFFFYGGTALATGRGEVISPLPPLPRSWIILIIPDTPRQPGKTKTAYQSLNPGHYSDGNTTHQLINNLESGKTLDDILLINAFERVALSLYPGLATLRQQFSESGIPNLHLAGSGPTLFSIYINETEARMIFSQLKSRHFQCYLTETI